MGVKIILIKIEKKKNPETHQHVQLLAQFLRQRTCVQHLSVRVQDYSCTPSLFAREAAAGLTQLICLHAIQIFFPTKLQTLPKDKYSSLLVLCSIQLLLRNTSVISNFISILYSFLGNNSKKQLSKIIVLKVKYIIFK